MRLFSMISKQFWINFFVINGPNLDLWRHLLAIFIQFYLINGFLTPLTSVITPIKYTWGCTAWLAKMLKNILVLNGPNLDIWRHLVVKITSFLAIFVQFYPIYSFLTRIRPLNPSSIKYTWSCPAWYATYFEENGHKWFKFGTMASFSGQNDVILANFLTNQHYI